MTTWPNQIHSLLINNDDTIIGFFEDLDKRMTLKALKVLQNFTPTLPPFRSNFASRNPEKKVPHCHFGTTIMAPPLGYPSNAMVIDDPLMIH